MAKKLKDEELCQKNLLTTTKALDSCWTNNVHALQWWQTPSYAVGGPIIAALLAGLAVSLIKK